MRGEPFDPSINSGQESSGQAVSDEEKIFIRIIALL